MVAGDAEFLGKQRLRLAGCNPLKQNRCWGQGLAIDGSGNVWVSCDNSTTGSSPAPVLE